MTQVNGITQLFGYILADLWFSSLENMVYKLNKIIICSIKSNRLVSLDVKTEFKAINSLDVKENVHVKVWFKGINFKVLIIKQAFKNKDGSTCERLLVSNDLNSSSTKLNNIYLTDGVSIIKA